MIHIGCSDDGMIQHLQSRFLFENAAYVWYNETSISIWDYAQKNSLPRERKMTMKKLLCIAVTIFLLMTLASGLAVDVYTDDIISNFGLILDGTPVQLPIPAATLINKGWNFKYAEPDPSWPFGKTKEESVLPSMTYDSMSIYKGDRSITVYLVNATDAEKQYEDCSIAGIGLFKADGIPFTLNNGIGFSSTFEDVCAAYGIAKEEILKDYTDGAAGFSVSFYAPENDGTHSDKGIDHVAVGMNQIDFQFDKPMAENGTLDYILVRYMNGAPEEEAEPAPADTQNSIAWTCTECGTANTGNFCTNCGTAKPEESAKFCTNCGWKIPEGTHPNFCQECGKEL